MGTSPFPMPVSLSLGPLEHAPQEYLRRRCHHVPPCIRMKASAERHETDNTQSPFVVLWLLHILYRVHVSEEHAHDSRAFVVYAEVFHDQPVVSVAPLQFAT